MERKRVVLRRDADLAAVPLPHFVQRGLNAATEGALVVDPRHHGDQRLVAAAGVRVAELDPVARGRVRARGPTGPGCRSWGLGLALEVTLEILDAAVRHLETLGQCGDLVLEVRVVVRLGVVLAIEPLEQLGLLLGHLRELRLQRVDVRLRGAACEQGQGAKERKPTHSQSLPRPNPPTPGAA